MTSLRAMGTTLGKALGYLIGVLLLLLLLAGVNWIASKTVWPFLFFVFQSLTTRSADLTTLAKISIIIVMLLAATFMSTAKEFSRLYGWGEIAVGVFLAWKTMSNAFSTDLKQNVLILVASLVVIEKGITRVEEGSEKARLKNKQFAKRAALESQGQSLDAKSHNTGDSQVS